MTVNTFMFIVLVDNGIFSIFMRSLTLLYVMYYIFHILLSSWNCNILMWRWGKWLKSAIETFYGLRINYSNSMSLRDTNVRSLPVFRPIRQKVAGSLQTSVQWLVRGGRVRGWRRWWRTSRQTTWMELSSSDQGDTGLRTQHRWGRHITPSTTHIIIITCIIMQLMVHYHILHITYLSVWYLRSTFCTVAGNRASSHTQTGILF